ncbi:MAG: family 78 glycoside hydrolase catalytic domain, partial [Acidobacteria bacterium]|nr:family 78 glycoside hydrolase catalytic domain [Acidobacteriota bacterium]
MHRHLLFLAAAGLAAQCAFAALAPVRLRCEYLENPRGIDTQHPRLSWVLESRPAGERDRKQTAYRVLVASSAAKLAGGTADLWDSGKIASAEQAQIEYAGQPLASRRPYCWKVQVWDNGGAASTWSPVARWSMGILDRAEWQAKWIYDPATVVARDADAKSRKASHNGYVSRLTDRPTAPRWAGVDLGSARTVNAVRLWAAQAERGSLPFQFPVQFRIEAASNAEFSNARKLVERSGADVAPPRPGTFAEFKFEPVTTQFLRLVSLKSGGGPDVTRGLALAELEVMASGTNVARGAKVLSADTTENGGWARENLVDGRTRLIDAAPPTQPVAAFRKSFRVTGPVKRATAYATARGAYQLRVNGTAADDRVLPPEFTDYARRLQYQTYDVTSQIKPGENVVSALVGAGWYSGRVGLYRRHMYGTQTAVLVRLEVETTDGRTATVVSDESWKQDPSPAMRSSDMLDGEVYDARLERAGWDAAGFDDHGWKAASADASLGEASLSAQPNEPVRPVLERKPVQVASPSKGVYVFDLGQNIVGWCRLRVKGARGQKISLRYGEALNDNGTLYTVNLRGAQQSDSFILKGGDPETHEPLFTYHGFRYAEVNGLTEPPTLDMLTGRVIYSSSPAAGKFLTSSKLLNQLMSNILWTQRGNMYSVPTDCPQRDERLGWMGDAQTFSQTAIFNMNMAGFYNKWVRDIRDDQLENGQFPDYAPNPGIRMTPPRQVGAPAWGDAGVIVPWRVWQNYGDKRILAEHFDAARRWVDFIHRNNPNFLWEKERTSDYNDWVNGDFVIQEGWPTTGGAIPKPMFATAFWAHSTDLVARMAGVLGKTEEAAQYRKLHENIRAAFNQTWVKPDGSIESGTQSAYALALHFDLLPEELRVPAVKNLEAGLERYHGHLSTGIHATHRLMLELARGGRTEEAYRALMLRSFPSWGFMIENGATTIWERWDGYV